MSAEESCVVSGFFLVLRDALRIDVILRLIGRSVISLLVMFGVVIILIFGVSIRFLVMALYMQFCASIVASVMARLWAK